MADVETTTRAKTFSGICQCCLLSSNILKDMVQNFIFKNKEETFSDMLRSCFSIEVTDCSSDSEDKLYLICNKCIGKLKTCYLFRIQVEKVQSKLKLNTAYISEHDPAVGEMFHEENIKQEFHYDADEGFDATDIFHLHDNNGDDDGNDVTEYNEDIKRGSEDEAKEEQQERLSSEEPEIEFKLKQSTKNKKRKLSIRQFKNKRTSKNVKKKSVEFKSLVKKKRKKDYVPYKLNPSDLVCYICNETFLLHKYLLFHMSVHFPNHVCDVCGKTFVKKQCLASHMSRLHDDQRFPCTVCNKLLKKQSMLRHMRTHSGDNYIHKCSACPQTFISYSSRIVHMRLVHNILRNIYKCNICPKSFEMKSDLAKHIKSSHIQEKNFECNICSAAFATSKRLQAHMSMHTGQKEFQCKVCLKSYARKSTLGGHMKIHNAFKKHACTICNKRFTHNCALKCHLKTHSKEINLDSNLINPETVQN